MIDKLRFLNEITNADWKDAIKQIPDNSIDLVVTDPPLWYEFSKQPTKS
jgi:DNA modification methylase